MAEAMDPDERLIESVRDQWPTWAWSIFVSIFTLNYGVS